MDGLSGGSPFQIRPSKDRSKTSVPHESVYFNRYSIVLGRVVTIEYSFLEGIAYSSPVIQNLDLILHMLVYTSNVC
jgi:hypothetical protein